MAINHMYTVYEIQLWPDGTLHNIESPGIGHDPEKTEEQNRNEASSEWHRILMYAAISQNLRHSAIIVRDDGLQIATRCYEHISEPEPEPEPEVEPEVIENE